jgi:hypothetical protein
VSSRQPKTWGRFRDVAPQTGLNVFASAGGVIVDDLSGNGRLDVVTSNFYSCGPLHYFGNNGDGTYTERTAAAGLRDQVGGLNIVQADYNNDRCTDILVMRGGWEVPQRKSLLRNNCNGTFTDVTAEAGLAVPATSTQAAAWADVNNDGWLDLFVGNEDTRAQLFLNDGKGHFSDIAKERRRGPEHVCEGCDRCRLRQRRACRLLRVELRRPESALSQQRGWHIHGPRGCCRCARCRSRIRHLVLRLRQRRLAGSVRDQLLHVARRHLHGPISACRTTPPR